MNSLTFFPLSFFLNFLNFYFLNNCVLKENETSAIDAFTKFLTLEIGDIVAVNNTEIELPDFADEKYWTRIRLRDMIGVPEMIF